MPDQPDPNDGMIAIGQAILRIHNRGFLDYTTQDIQQSLINGGYLASEMRRQTPGGPEFVYVDSAQLENILNQWTSQGTSAPTPHPSSGTWRLNIDGDGAEGGTQIMGQPDLTFREAPVVDSAWAVAGAQVALAEGQMQVQGEEMEDIMHPVDRGNITTVSWAYLEQLEKKAALPRAMVFLCVGIIAGAGAGVIGMMYNNQKHDGEIKTLQEKHEAALAEHVSEREAALNANRSWINVTNPDGKGFVALKFADYLGLKAADHYVEKASEYAAFAGNSDLAYKVKHVSENVVKGSNTHAERLQRVFDYAKSFTVIEHPESKDAKAVNPYARLPLETMVDGWGTEADITLAAAGMLHSLGEDFVLLHYPKEGENPAHLALAVKAELPASKEGRIIYEIDGAKFYHFDTTAGSIGEMPKKLEGRDPELYKMPKQEEAKNEQPGQNL